jgi:hypothetical protein
MTTFTTEDRIIAEKDGSLTVNVEGGTVKMNEPVAWMNSKGDIILPAHQANKEYNIPLYTHPVKEQLTDEDLELITEALLMVGFTDSFINYDLKEQALAILRKASEK